ncbi:MAG: tetraacyldisaccharide 4'-kinase [Endomicrobiaceae bacterium]|jgi:tetraacyldisaccharide 4'-kinase|nr:tetraacyldisaccharide 4'-kinase [Endomicrobiaceae bacterium]MDD3729801.1 tetraacyldisaccharide 4'-kinase [Endomicrobiaceae bacterium]MDD4166163.1 tetraacyldisaccharide 4'-kinase [Endomicrobiaceae bacterium]
MKKFLYPLSFIYNIISELNRKITKSVKLDKPVISVGNITWGGSAKTPVVVEVVKYILSLKKTPVVLSRGYGRKIVTKNSVIVRDTNKILSSLEMAGDEPYMVAQKISCPVIVGANRVKSAEVAKKFNPDVFVLDDGFQHWKLKRDLDIVCVNAANPFGNEMIIPAGILRESLDALKRAGIVIITNSDLVTKERLELLDGRIYDITGKKSLKACYGNFKLKNMYDNSFVRPEVFNKNIFTVCAIGSPDNFKNSIIKLGLKIKKEFVFRDHYGYSANDIEKIYKQMSDSDIILTTEKDGIKIKEIINDGIKKKIFTLSGEIIFNFGKEKFEEKIAEILR